MDNHPSSSCIWLQYFPGFINGACIKCSNLECSSSCNSCINCDCRKLCHKKRCSDIKVEEGKFLRCKTCDGCINHFGQP